MTLSSTAALNKRRKTRLVCRRCSNAKRGEIELYAVRLGDGTFTDSPECRDMLACERRTGVTKQ